MHPCDAKGIFFSEVEVLRARQSKRSPATYLHVAFDGLCVGPCGGAGVGVAVVFTECLLLLFHVYNVCVCVFLAFTAKLHFVCVFTV